jgi:hypothetical protein
MRDRQRAAYAARLGAEPGDVALTTCTSEGIVRVLAGLDLGPGDEVLTAPDEHPGLLGPLATLRARRGVTVRTAPLADLPAAGAADTDAARAEAVRRFLSQTLERAHTQAAPDQALAYRALDLAYLQRGLSHERAAERLNVSRATFYRLLKRGVQTLAAALDPQPASPS